MKEKNVKNLMAIKSNNKNKTCFIDLKIPSFQIRKSEQEKMEISVIVSIYNGGKNIKSSIESILNQTYGNFELILIDDGSNDNSFEIMKFYSNLDKRIKILRNKSNIGLTKSLNKGIKLSKGNFIARQDIDDISLPNRLQLQLEFLSNNPDYAFCGSNIYIKQNRNKSLEIFKFKGIKKNLIINNCFIHSTILIRKKVLNKYGLYNEKWFFGQDYELWCQLIYKYQLKAQNLKKKLVIMNIPNKNLIQKDSKFLIQHKNSIKTRLRHLKYIKNPYSILMSIIYIIINSIVIFLAICRRIVKI